MTRKVLIIDDDLVKPKFKSIFLSNYRVNGYEYIFAGEDNEAIKIIEKDGDISLIMLDIRFEGKSDVYGIKILKDLKQKFPNIPVVMMSARTEPEILIQCWDLGARSYIVKWADNPNFKKDLEEKLKLSLYHPREPYIGFSSGIMEVKKLISSLEGQDVDILIEGESGTGKSLLAENVIFKRSKRGLLSKQFIKVRTTMPTELLDSELFGHKKGAFTGAIEDREGRISQANRGALFFDEIGELKPELQAKLLEFLDTGRYSRLGENRVLESDVKIYAATHRNLKKMIQNGEFSEALYYRLAKFVISLPPLRECVEDIPIFANHFLELCKNENPKNVTGFSKDVMDILRRYKWPGNVRELQNVVERAYILTPEGEIPQSVLSDHLLGKEEKGSGMYLEKFPDSFDFDKYLGNFMWKVIKRISLDEFDKKGKRIARKIVAERLGLHPVNGIGRKLDDIKKVCPELREEIEDFEDKIFRKSNK